jgi:hypothetical protein
MIRFTYGGYTGTFGHNGRGFIIRPDGPTARLMAVTMADAVQRRVRASDRYEPGDEHIAAAVLTEWNADITKRTDPPVVASRDY